MPTAVLSERHDAGAGLLLVKLDVPPEVARAYATPGQYVQVTTPAGRGYFVLANDVGTAPWELLVKNAGDAADALLSLPLGSSLDVVGPLGKGFPLVHATSRPVVVAVVGSAFAVARPVISVRVAEGAARSTFLLLGVRAPNEQPLPDEVAAWLEAGVHVHLCLSRSELDHHRELLPGAKRVAGYVQTALEQAVQSGEIPPGALVVAAGPDAMIAELRAFAGQLGASATVETPPIEVVTNI